MSDFSSNTIVSKTFTGAAQETGVINGDIKEIQLGGNQVSHDFFFIGLDADTGAGFIELHARMFDQTGVELMAYVPTGDKYDTKGIYKVRVSRNQEYKLVSDASFTGSVLGVLDSAVPKRSAV